MPDLAAILSLLQLALRDRQQIVQENIALRHQLVVYKRSVKRPRIDDRDRISWLAVMRLLREWREALVIVTAETAIRWQRQGCRYYWRWKSRIKPGRPPISMELILLIRRMSRENILWGAKHIRYELALLGYQVCITTVAKYMVKHRSVDAGQRWTRFLRNHMARTAACDFFVVPTITFKLL